MNNLFSHIGCLTYFREFVNKAKLAYSMTQPIDIAFLVAKVATLKDEKAKILVDGASLAYNVAMVNRLMNVQKEYISICCTIEQVSRLRGYCTQEEYSLALECQHHIAECESELRKHKVMTAVDFTGLVVSGLTMLMKK